MKPRRAGWRPIAHKWRVLKVKLGYTRREGQTIMRHKDDFGPSTRRLGYGRRAGAVLLVAALASSSLVLAQDQAPVQNEAPVQDQAPDQDGATTLQAPVAEADGAEGTYVVEVGTRIPLSMVNSVSTKHSEEGDRVYLETTFPIAVNGRIVIPAGSYVLGTISSMQRPGKVAGRGEFFLRFDELMLPNGVTRDFRGRVAGLDGRASEDLDKDEGKVSSEGNKAGDARTVAEAAATGAGLGGLAGIGINPGMGVGIGAGAGLAAGLIGVLMSRGPDAVLAKGTTVEMVLDRQLVYSASELDFSGAPPHYQQNGGGPMPSVKTRRQPSFP